MSKLILLAPLEGWCGPLDEVPDPVFSGRLLGDGIAIDPTGTTVHAPCDGELIAVPSSKHAVTLRAEGGAQVLIHVGVDTVALGGVGFELHVAQGERVRAGQPLLSFDLDELARRARSLLTPVIAVEDAGFAVIRRAEPGALRVGEFLMELEGGAAAAVSSGSAAGGEQRSCVKVLAEHGIHARPAALLASALKPYTAQITASAHGRRANARSAVAWMELGVRYGDEVALTAWGEDAVAALAALEAALAAAARLGPATQPNRPPQPVLAPSAAAPSAQPVPAGALRGVVASRGLAVGPAALIGGAAAQIAEAGTGLARESAELSRARAEVGARLQRLREGAGELAREVLEAHLAFLDDPELLAAAQRWIGQGKSAGYAWQQAVEESAAALLRIGDARMAERGDDLRDLAGQVLRVLAGHSAALEVAEGSILIGEQLLPSQLVALGPARIAGFATAAGGPTSHVALLAAAMEIPALVALGSALAEVTEGTPLVLDAEQGLLRVAPDAATLAAAERALADRRMRVASAKAAARSECRLASGERIEIFANLGAASEGAGAIAQGAEGCGLLRTEFLFLERDTPPSEEQQRQAYQDVLDALGGRPLVIRTLDAGGDKPLRYLPLPEGENPALGLRGVRASLWSPPLLRTQLRAILQLRPLAACRIMLPMVSDTAEVRAVRRVLDELRAELGIAESVRLGIMIETPASALIAERLVPICDFFSIGSNDLAQYTLAMDRGQAELAAQLDALHPGVLRLIQVSAAAARAGQRSVSVCGGLASDPSAAALLVGLGVSQLSAVPSVIPELKAQLRKLRLEECRALAQRALEAESAQAVRALALGSVQEDS